jgi:GTPase SAR1 family protein
MLDSQMGEKVQKISEAVLKFGDLIGKKHDDAGLGMLTDSENFKFKAEDIRKGIFKVLVMGSFSAGKSTTLNAMIGNDFLIAKATASSAIITSIVYGTETDTYRVYYEGEVEPKHFSVQEFKKAFTLKPQDSDDIVNKGQSRFSNIRHSEIESNLKLFENGVRLMDSPGLGDSAAQTRVVTDHLPKVDAIIFLLNANNLFSNEERNFISSRFAGKHSSSVFFLVNKINQLTGPMEDVVDSVSYHLNAVFQDEDGMLDQSLFDRRVFYINAYGALKARMEGDRAALQATGMLEFEAELERFLTSDERMIATFETTIQTMANSYINAETLIANEKAALKAPLDELEKRHKASQKALDELESQIEDMKKIFRSTSAQVQNKIFQDLREFISFRLPKMWDSDAEKIEAKFGVKELLTLAWQSVTTFDENERARRQAAIIDPIAKGVQQYLVEKLDAWGNSTDLLISPEIEAFKQEFEDQIDEMNLSFKKASAIFSGNLGGGQSDGKGANVFQLCLSLIQGDVNVLVENAAGGNFTWGEWIKKYAIQAVMQLMIFGIFSGGLGFAVWFAVEIVQLSSGANRMKDKLLLGMSTKLFSELSNAVTQKEAEIKAGIDQKFTSQFETVTKHVHNLINEEKTRQEGILTAKSSESFNMAKEVERMNGIQKTLFSLLDDVYAAYNGRA